MKIESNKFLAFNMHPLMREELVELYENEVHTETINEKLIRRAFMQMYLSPSPVNYLFTKSAMNTVKDIKINDSAAIRSMILDYADKEATFLINEKEYVKFVSKTFDHYFGQKSVVVMHIKMDEVGYISYEGFNILEDEINHPRYIKGEPVEEIETFLKMMIFVKCTNTEIEVLGKPGNKEGNRIKLDGEKYLNLLDQDVTLVNSKYNKITIRDEAFYVNTHGRFQRYGEKSSKVKYIIIDGYYKKGYTRGIKKD